MQCSRCGNEWRNKANRTVNMVLIDMEKACDSVPHQEVWRRNSEKGLPDNYVMIVQDMYERAITRAKTNVGTWAVNKSQYVAEMRVLRWMSGVTKLDRIKGMKELEG